MSDSCIAQAAVGAAFGGMFGGMVGAATTTFFPTNTVTARSGLAYTLKTSAKYALVVSTFSGVSCASESLTQKKGPHNSIAAGISVGVVAALLTSNHKHGLAVGGMTSVCMAALDLAGGSFDSRTEKDFEKLSGVHAPK